MTNPLTTRLLALALGAALLAGCTTTASAPPHASGAAEAGAPRALVEVGIIAFNDFHGNLEPPRRAVTLPGPHGEAVQVPAGGAAWLASALDDLRSRYAHHLTVSAGDMTGASQLASALFLDEPTIGVMNRIGLDFNAVGNHEFDRGWQELIRLQQGGCAQWTVRDPCAVEPDFAGARFNYLAANVDFSDGTPLFPGSALRQFGEGDQRVAVGVIGLTLKGTPTLVTPAGVAGLNFADEADRINSATGLLRRAGAAAVVVLIHEGISVGGAGDPNACVDPQGALLPILERLDGGVDVIVSGHTHRSHICEWHSADRQRSFLLTSAGNYGMLATDITLAIDPAARQVVARRAVNVPVQSEPFRDITLTNAATAYAPRADIADYVARYVAAAQDFSGRPAGFLQQRTTRDGPGGGALGRLIADAQLAATRDAGAQIAFMNPFGIRADLEPSAQGMLTFGDLYRAQPFDNTLITLTLTGAQLLALLESQADGSTREQVLAVSEGFSYTLDRSREPGSRIGNAMLNGAPVDPAGRYRITVNSFLASGGDGFAILNDGTERTVGMADIVALEAWLKRAPARAAPAEPRVRILPESGG